jgi:hypothetical protein
MSALWRLIALIFASQLFAGCTTFYSARLSNGSSSTNAQLAPVDLSPFWKANGFKLVDRNDPEQGVQLYQNSNSTIMLSVWQKWFKGVVFTYAGNISGFEDIRDGQYCIQINPLGGHQQEAAKVRDDLREFLVRNYPNLEFTFEEDQVYDPR